MRAQVMQMFGDMDQPFRSATLKEYTASGSFPTTIPLVTHNRAQLPTEILTIIFALVARQHASECLLNGDDDRPDTWMAWVPLMLVCRRWRDIGISTPWLWRRIAITNDLESLQYRLSHTSNCVIDIFPSNNASVNKHAMPLLLPFAPFVRSIQTGRLSTAGALAELKPLFSVALPALEHLSVTAEHKAGASSTSRLDLGFSEALHPNIRTFQAFAVATPTSPGFWTSLRELTVQYATLDDAPSCAEDLFYILAGSTQLRSLNVYPRIGDRYPLRSIIPLPHNPPQGRYPLLHLQAIDIEGPPRFVASVLQKIEAPALTTLQAFVSVEAEADAAEIPSDMFPQWIRNLADSCEELEAIWDAETHGFRISAYEAPDPGSNEENSSILSIGVSGEMWSVPPLSVAINMLCSLMGTASPQSLTFQHFKTSAPAHAWRSLQSTFHTVCSLSMACDTDVVTPFLHTIGPTSIAGDWPALQELILDIASDSLNSLEAYHLLDAILCAMRARNFLGLPFEALDVCQPNDHSGIFRIHRWMLLELSKLCDTFTFADTSEGSFTPELEELEELFEEAEPGRFSALENDGGDGCDEWYECVSHFD